MRKKLLFFATVAIAALASCSKTEIRPEVESRDVHFVVNTAENEVVKSFIQNNNDRTYTPKWSNGDELAIFIGETKSITKATGVLKNTNATGTTAKFDGKIPESLQKGHSSHLHRQLRLRKVMRMVRSVLTWLQRRIQDVLLLTRLAIFS